MTALWVHGLYPLGKLVSYFWSGDNIYMGTWARAHRNAQHAHTGVSARDNRAHILAFLRSRRAPCRAGVVRGVGHRQRGKGSRQKVRGCEHSTSKHSPNQTTKPSNPFGVARAARSTAALRAISAHISRSLGHRPGTHPGSSQLAARSSQLVNFGHKKSPPKRAYCRAVVRFSPRGQASQGG